MTFTFSRSSNVTCSTDSHSRAKAVSELDAHIRDAVPVLQALEGEVVLLGITAGAEDSPNDPLLPMLVSHGTITQFERIDGITPAAGYELYAVVRPRNPARAAAGDL